jgi:hypothetical protein
MILSRDGSTSQEQISESNTELDPVLCSQAYRDSLVIERMSPALT